MRGLRRTPIRRVLHRQNLLLGGERELVLMTLIVCGGLAVAGMNVPSFASAAIIWFGSIVLFRQMAKSDPQMTRVYMRHRRYSGYYPARSRPYRGEKGWFHEALFWSVVAALALVLLYCFRAL